MGGAGEERSARSIGDVPELRENPDPTLAAAVIGVLPGARADLERLVRIPSIWADPAHADDTRRSAEAVAALVDALDFGRFG